MGNLGSLRVWQDPAIRGALSWYLEVAENRRPAKFRIASTLATDSLNSRGLFLASRFRPFPLA
jgi:hypothetical protein